MSNFHLPIIDFLRTKPRSKAKMTSTAILNISIWCTVFVMELQI